MTANEVSMIKSNNFSCAPGEYSNQHVLVHSSSLNWVFVFYFTRKQVFEQAVKALIKHDTIPNPSLCGTRNLFCCFSHA